MSRGFGISTNTDSTRSQTKNIYRVTSYRLFIPQDIYKKNIEMSCKVELTKIYDSKGIDGLSRLDRRKSSSYNRQEFLFDKYLQKRKEKPKLDLTHHQILGNVNFQ